MPPVPATIPAAAVSHESWNIARAQTSGGTDERLGGGVVAAWPGQAHVLFPDTDRAATASIVDELRRRTTTGPPTEQIGWWATSADQNVDVGTSLLARGFGWGWPPRWMGVTPATLEPVAVPDGIVIEPVTDEVGWDVPGLPYGDADDGPKFRRLSELTDRPSTSFAALDRGRVVGRVLIHVSPPDPDGRHGVTETVGGIFDMGVVEAARRRGIGGALAVVAARHAFDRGVRLVTLNATAVGEPVYARVGFEAAGWGQTWWMIHQLADPPPSAGSVAFVEAIGFGDVDALDAVVASDHPDLDRVLPCGRTPIEIAVLMHQPATARRLVELGATLGILDAWDLGWKEEAAQLLADDPSRADVRGGRWGATPLQIAIERDDRELFDLVLAAGPDLSIRDRQFQSDARGWAEHLGRPHLAALLPPTS